MKIHYDAKVDVLYIELRSIEPGTTQSQDLNEDITVNYGPDGKIAGIEIINATPVLGEDFQKVIVELSPAFV